MTINLIGENELHFNPYLSVAYTDGDLFSNYELACNRIEKLILKIPLSESNEAIKLVSELEKVMKEVEKITSALRANGYSKQVYSC
jgi:hypothetical protein